MHIKEPKFSIPSQILHQSSLQNNNNKKKICCFSPKNWQFVVACHFSGEEQAETAEMQSIGKDMKWAMSGRQASPALIVSVPFIYSGCSAFLQKASACSPKPRSNTTFIFRHNGALATRHEIAFFTMKTAAIWQSTQSDGIWIWSKIDLQYTLKAWDTYRKQYYCNMMQHFPLLDLVAHSIHVHSFLCIYAMLSSLDDL